MPYIVINKKSKKVSLYGSLPVLSKTIGYRLQTLQNHFGRYKEKQLFDYPFEIHRVSLVRSERK